MEKPCHAPRLPSRAAPGGRGSRCCWSGARGLLVLLSLLSLAAAAGLGALLFTGSVVTPSWFYINTALPAAAAILGIILVGVGAQNRRCRAHVILASLHTFISAVVVVCGLIGLLRHSTSIKLSQQESVWRLDDTFSDCEQRQDECHCRHSGSFQRVELNVCDAYRLHQTLLTHLALLQAAFVALVVISVLSAATSGFLLISSRTRSTHRFWRRNKHSAPNNYTLASMHRATSLPSLTSGVYERIDSVVSSSYLNPLRATVLSELDDFLSRRAYQTHTVGTRPGQQGQQGQGEPPTLPRRPPQMQADTTTAYVVHSQRDPTYYSPESQAPLWNTM